MGGVNLNDRVSNSDLLLKYENLTQSTVDNETLHSALNCLSLRFNTDRKSIKGTNEAVADIYDYEILINEGDVTRCGQSLAKALKNEVFSKYLLDSTEYFLKIFLTKLITPSLSILYLRIFLLR